MSGMMWRFSVWRENYYQGSNAFIVEGIDYLNELGRRTLLVTKMKHIIFSRDCQLLYREVIQLASLVVLPLLASAMIITPSATPNYIHPQYLRFPGTLYWGFKQHGNNELFG